MKITISYTTAEEQDATAVLATLRPLLTWEKVHKSDRHTPFLHIYLTTRKPGKACDSKEKT